MTSDKAILEIINGIKIDFVDQPVQYRILKEIKCSNNEKLLIDIEIEKYIKQDIIHKVYHSENEFISQVFPRLKKSGGVRIISNLSELNLNIEYCHFKMENLNTVLGLIESNCFMASIDLKDAYFTVNVDPEYRKFLRFFWNDELYEFRCMPNGLSCAPRIFTKILKPIFF